MEPQPHPHDLERLGETAEFRSLLLRLLALAGWQVDVRPMLGGGVIVIASRRGRVIERAGAAVEDLAIPIFVEAMQRSEAT